MNQAFITAFSATLTAAVADLRYCSKPTVTSVNPTGDLVVPQVITPMLPAKAAGYQEGGELPLCRWLITSGHFSMRQYQPFKVQLDLGLYTPGTIEDGNAAILEFAMAVGGHLVKYPWYKPYKMIDDIEFHIGSREAESLGSQPHPYYWATMLLDFVGGTRTT